MKHKWWKYILAVLVFVIAITVFPLIIGLVWTLFNLFSPRFYQSSEQWILIISTILGTATAIGVAEQIVEGANTFVITLCVIFAVFAIAVGVWNYALGSTYWYNMVSMIASGVVGIIHAIKIAMSSKSE